MLNVYLLFGCITIVYCVWHWHLIKASNCEFVIAHELYFILLIM